MRKSRSTRIARLWRPIQIFQRARRLFLLFLTVCYSQGGLLLPGSKAIRGEAAPLGRKEAAPSWAEGNPSQSEGNPNLAEGIPSRAEGNPNVCPSVKSRSFNGLRSTPAGGLGVTARVLFAVLSPNLVSTDLSNLV